MIILEMNIKVVMNVGFYMRDSKRGSNIKTIAGYTIIKIICVQNALS